MSENIQSTAVLEAELNELSRQIAEKRNQLEASRGVKVEHREAIHEVVGKEVYGESYVPPPPPPPPAQSNQQANQNAQPVKPTAPSYLDRLDPQSVAMINELIQALPKEGIKSVINRARNFTPFVLDAFHDALVDRLYEELQRSKLID